VKQATQLALQLLGAAALDALFSDFVSIFFSLFFAFVASVVRSPFRKFLSHVFKFATQLLFHSAASCAANLPAISGED